MRMRPYHILRLRLRDFSKDKRGTNVVRAGARVVLEPDGKVLDLDGIGLADLYCQYSPLVLGESRPSVPA